MSVAPVSRLLGMPHREHENRVDRGDPAVERQVSLRSPAHDQFPPARLDLPADQRVPLENQHTVTEAVHRLQRPLRIGRRNELEDPLQIGECASTQDDARHAFMRGRRAVLPERRASKYAKASRASNPLPDAIISVSASAASAPNFCRSSSSGVRSVNRP